MTPSLHPLTTLLFVLVLICLVIFVWAIRRFEKRLAAVESRPAGRVGIKAVPVVDQVEDVNGGFSIDGLEHITRAHIAPEPLAAADHLGRRVDVTI